MKNHEFMLTMSVYKFRKQRNTRNVHYMFQSSTQRIVVTGEHFPRFRRHESIGWRST